MEFQALDHQEVPGLVIFKLSLESPEISGGESVLGLGNSMCKVQRRDWRMFKGRVQHGSSRVRLGVRGGREGSVHHAEGWFFLKW